MTYRYADTHCHLASDHFEADRAAVVDASLAAGVAMLAVGADLPSSRLSVALAAGRPGVLASAGVHPNDVATLDATGWKEITRLAGRPETAAVGETGLDYYWRDVPPDIQKEWFVRHIELALALGKPLVVHARESVGDVLAVLEPFLREGLRAVWHCFTAPKREIGTALDFAAKNRLFLAVGGLVTFEDQKALREHAKRIPGDLLLLETDAPYLVPRPKSSNRNDPRGVIRVAEVLAELRGTTPTEIATITTRNAVELFGFPASCNGMP